jgi:hypothetical protein
MKPLPDPARSLAGCPEVIFIVYCLPADAEGRGYADWLYRVDMPFFNAIPGVHHYANWRIADVLRGERPLWDWFDFQGLVSGTALESVWFNPDLDEFRANWVKLWGYGHADPPPVLRHAYLMRSMTARPPDRPWSEALLAGGQGDAPTLARDPLGSRGRSIPRFTNTSSVAIRRGPGRRRATHSIRWGWTGLPALHRTRAFPTKPAAPRG